MTDCNYLYIIGWFSLCAAAASWSLLIYWAVSVNFIGGGCQWLWELLLQWTGAEQNAGRKGYVTAILDMLLFVVCPIVIVFAGYLAHWCCHSDARSFSGLAEGRNGGDRASVWGLDLRWIPDENSPCWMMEREVTQGLWRSISRDYPSIDSAYDDYPVSFTTFYAIKEFVRNMERRHPVRGWQWDVPTECQWRAACLAGGPTPSGEIMLNHGWLRENSGRHAHASGELSPNDWGLRDIIGNVAEAVRDECGLSLWGGDYDTVATRTPSDESELCLGEENYASDILNTAYCCVDKEDGFNIWATRRSDDEIVEEIGLRLCLIPNLLSKAYPGATFDLFPPFTLEQTPAVIAYSNYILIYGLLFLVLEITVSRCSKRWPWLARWSVFDEWHKLFSCKGRKRICLALKMIAKYLIDCGIALFVTSPLALLIPDMPDPVFSVPDALLVIIVGFAISPLIVSAYAAVCIFRSFLRDLGSHNNWEKAREVYALLFLPLAMLLAIMTIRDLAYPFWREFTKQDAHNVQVATPFVKEKSVNCTFEEE